jgi:hypothetical protein
MPATPFKIPSWSIELRETDTSSILPVFPTINAACLLTWMLVAIDFTRNKYYVAY